MVLTVQARRQVCRYKTQQLRKAITRMRKLKKVKRGAAGHPAVSKMTSQQVMAYMYSTASEHDWDWATVLSTEGHKQRITKACREAPATQAVKEVPQQLQKMSRWQSTVKKVFQDPKHKGKTIQEKMKEAKKLYTAPAPAPAPVAAPARQPGDYGRRMRQAVDKAERRERARQEMSLARRIRGD